MQGTMLALARRAACDSPGACGSRPNVVSSLTVGQATVEWRWMDLSQTLSDCSVRVKENAGRGGSALAIGERRFYRIGADDLP